MKSGRKNSLFALLASFIWGVAFVAQKVNTVGTLTYTMSRSVIAVVFLFVLILVMTKGDVKHVLCEETKEKTKTLWIGGILCGIVMVSATISQQASMDLGSEAGKVGFLTAFYMILVPVFGLFQKRKVPWAHWITVLVALVGLYLLCFGNGISAVRPSDFLGLLCAFIFTMHIMVIDKYSPLVNTVKMSCIQFITAAVVAGIAAFLFEDVSLAGIGENIWSLLYVGIFSSGVAYTLQIAAQSGGNPAVVSILMSLESAFSVLASAIILHEVLRPSEYVGCALMFAAVILTQFTDKLTELFSKKK